MATRINPDGSITVGVLVEQVEDKTVEQTEETAPQPKKSTKKKSK